MSERIHGTVRWFSRERGFGFCNVDGDETQTDYFIHYSSINMDDYKMLRPKQKVTFILKQTSEGNQATEVVPE